MMSNNDVYYIHPEEPDNKCNINIRELWNKNYLNICELFCIIVFSYDIYAYSWCNKYCGFYIFNTLMVIIYLFIYYITKLLTNNFNDNLSRDDYKRSLCVLIVLFIYFLILDYVLIILGSSINNDEKIKLNILDEYIFISIFSKMLINWFYMYIAHKNRVNTVNIAFYNLSAQNLNL